MLGALAFLAGVGTARAEGVGQVLTSKSIPAATVALIDPESGTSSGGSTTDVNVAVGDVILFQFNFSAVPDLRAAGLQGYLTEYIPANTQVVGVRLIDKNGLTIVPRLPGIAEDSCQTNCPASMFDNLTCTAGAGCSGGQVDLTNGSIAQVYADTGVFFANDSRLARTPANQFITLQNGISMTALGTEPTEVTSLAPLIGAASPYYTHALWDYVQMLAYGWKNNAYSGNGGKNNTPFLYGSPVAGPQTYYQYEATPSTLVPSTTQPRFNGVVGPWQRIRYPGSKIGTGSAVTSTNGAVGRMAVDTTAANWGWDLRPNDALPMTSTALRYALGEVRVGEVRAAEVALRVLATPLDPSFGATGGDVDCAEVVGTDVSADSSGARADDNPWSMHLPSPNCVYLNLLFDLQVNKPVADGSDVLLYTLRVKNLSKLTQSSVQIAARYAGSDFGFVSASNGGAQATCPAGIGGTGNTCVVWPTIATFAPSDEYIFTFQLSVGGQGSGANVVFGSYRSNSLPAPGFTTQALTIVKPVAVLDARLAPNVATATAGTTVGFSGALRNQGNQLATMQTLTINLPAGWTISGTPALTEGSLSCSSGCATNTPTYTFSGATVNPYPQCNDGIDNADPEDTLPDTLDPGCASPLDDDETAGTTLVANPEIGITFNVNIPGGTGNGSYNVELQTFHTQQGIGGDTETYLNRFSSVSPRCSDGLDNDGDTFFDYPSDPGCSSALDDDESATLAYVPELGVIVVGTPRTARPTLNCPIGDIATVVTGNLAAGTPLNAQVRLYFNGIERASGAATAQTFSISGFGGLPACSDGVDNDGDGAIDYPADIGCATPYDNDEAAPVTVHPQFGDLYGGLEIRASATGAGELESPLSEPCLVSVVPDCSDGKDNDRDGVADFPADPGCASSGDGSEDDPECSDGIDNDFDGDVDWPQDLECYGPDDIDEGGAPGCGDGIDNDGDGLIDYPADPGCTSITDRTEVQLGACQDGADNDNDTFVDYPADPGCHSANDDSEADLTLGDIRSRLLMLFDTSGSMNWNTCAETFTGGDGSLECAGGAVSCATCDSTNCLNTLADDSRLYKVKAGVTDVVSGFGDVEYGLMRFHQRAAPFACPTANASAGSGGWQGAGPSPCGGGFAAGDLLVNFSAENQYDLLEYIDGQSNYPGTPPPGMDFELRGSGTTPLAGTLSSALVELQSIQAGDAAGSCRPYIVILLTDGQETCGGDAVTAAQNLKNAGIDVYVIGFATTDPAITANLDAIAAAGRTGGTAIYVDDSATLASKMSQIVADSILTEVCNGTDDDCDLRVDEGFTLYCDKPGAHSLQDLCLDPGETVCDGVDDNCNGKIDEGLTNACGQCGALPAEICNGLDDDCNGVIDENNVCGSCPRQPEICNNVDDDCDGQTDESLTRACGTDVGACTAGTETCSAGAWAGCTAIAGSVETCNNIDDDCDGTIDGITRSCGTDVGACQLGSELCLSGTWGTCVGAIGPVAEVCNNVDDNCNSQVDEGNPQGGGICGSSIGACDTGTFLCTGGVLVCSGETPPAPETCNSVDDDCDGKTDESVPTGGPCGNGTGDCDPGVLTCLSGSMQCVGATLGGPESCDGRDNDCDGSIDEGLTRSCGTSTGECTVGTEICSAGAWINCTGQAPVAEICNSLDDDCDGVPDDDVATSGACGGSLGVCSPGVLTCKSGTFQCIGEKTGGAESCDNLDNDCDGQTDEGLTQPCGTDVGECTTGTATCSAGQWINCTGQAPVAESCNSKDDDCNGLTDDGVPTNGACGGSVGDCSPGVLTCISGAFVCLGAQLGGPEACDNADNDCDGLTDEGLSRQCGTDVGQCAVGTETCNAGNWVGCSAVTPIAETCNGLDDDCDGVADDDVPTAGPCGGSVGDCSPGVLVCVSGSLVCLGAQLGGPEDCDNADNDCDGQIDEGLTRACGTDVGECALGSESCSAGSWVGCDAVVPVNELCNDKDDDCDGLTDEGNPEGGGSCGATDVGACEFGLEKCQAGTLVCVGEKTPLPEICNGLDDNCDGQVDENNPEGGQACGDNAGACQGGTTLCTGGQLVCQNAVSTSPEVCNGIDDDCDGVIDDGFPVGGPCGSDVGACDPGIYNCQNNLLVCVGGIVPVAETCNGIDDDCDGDTDDVGVGGPCGIDEGLCKEGNYQCIDGVEVCVNQVAPATEVCDCDDNDCDGKVDETPTTGDLCPSGAACLECQCALPCKTDEFGRCPTGKFPLEGDDGCFCVESKCYDDECAGETHGDGQDTLCAPDDELLPACVCRNNACTYPCNGMTCQNGLTCHPRSGLCVENNCRGLGCPSGEMCDVPTGECTVDRCQGVVCSAGQVCRDGACEKSCATVKCGKGESCEQGECKADPCGGVSCDFGQTCDPKDGSCVQDQCIGIECIKGQICDALSGDCVTDPCNVVKCPAGQTCKAGECALPVGTVVDGGTIDDKGTVQTPDPDVDPERRVVATGGGGCGNCSVGAQRSQSAELAWSLSLLLLAAFLVRRRRVR